MTLTENLPVPVTGARLVDAMTSRGWTIHAMCGSLMALFTHPQCPGGLIVKRQPGGRLEEAYAAATPEALTDARVARVALREVYGPGHSLGSMIGWAVDTPEGNLHTRAAADAALSQLTLAELHRSREEMFAVADTASLGAVLGRWEDAAERYAGAVRDFRRETIWLGPETGDGSAA